MTDFQHCASCGKTHHGFTRRHRELETFLGPCCASACLIRFFDKDNPVEIIDKFFTSLPEIDKLVKEARLLPPLKNRKLFKHSSLALDSWRLQ
ncbi:hypothetical protein [Peribacillus glennii]|uniref:Uncharacterized protein n=1 Tax=Peribacillus glennii TaxID=2303991 RepID=A0A372LAF2_9BACI|nr:hypothetical protein [Peribacillus glennii]RFU61743.1 hypothetical protein D0466_16495 [Peribacillus glennii]